MPGVRRGLLRKEISGHYSATASDKQGWYQGKESEGLASGTKFKRVPKSNQDKEYAYVIF